MKVKVKSYQRHTKSGKVVTIKEHERGPRSGKNGQPVEKSSKHKKGAGEEFAARKEEVKEQPKAPATEQKKEDVILMSPEERDMWLRYEAQRAAMVAKEVGEVVSRHYGTQNPNRQNSAGSGDEAARKKKNVEDVLARAEALGKKRMSQPEEKEDFLTRSGLRSFNRRAEVRSSKMEKGLDSFIKKYGSKKGFKRYV
jgi:hypothetical protein